MSKRAKSRSLKRVARPARKKPGQIARAYALKHSTQRHYRKDQKV